MSIEKKKVSDYVIEDFERKIRSGEIKKGDKLPNQNEYAKQLGISRLSLREALQTLQMMGAVIQRPKIGTVVICDNPDLWSRNITDIFINNTKIVNELMEARMLIETKVVELCVANASEEDVMALRQLVDEHEEDVKKSHGTQDAEQYTECDINFHLKIALSSGNRFLAQMYGGLLQITSEFICQSFSRIPSTIPDAIRLHRQIYNAIEARNTVLARQLMEEHILTAQKHCLVYFESV